MVQFFEKHITKMNEFRKIDGHMFYRFRFQKRRVDANTDAGDAREYGYPARVLPHDGGWLVVIRRG